MCLKFMLTTLSPGIWTLSQYEEWVLSTGNFVNIISEVHTLVVKGFIDKIKMKIGLIFHFLVFI